MLPPPPVIRRGGVKPSFTGSLSSSVITDFFSPVPKRIKMDRCDIRSWSDEEEFLTCTQRYVEKSQAPQGGGEDDDKMGDEEFGELSWFEEQTSLYLGRESLGCGDKSMEKEDERRDDLPSEKNFVSKDDRSGSWSDHMGHRDQDRKKVDKMPLFFLK